MSENHIIGFKTYSSVLISLLALTVITVGVAQIDFGGLKRFSGNVHCNHQSGIGFTLFHAS